MILSASPSSPCLSAANSLLISDASDVPLTGLNCHFPGNVALHRIRAVRLEEGVTIRSIACLTGESRRKIAEEEIATTDLTLSRLQWWKEVLKVPIADLLVEPDTTSLSPLVLQRVRILRMMKTVAAIKREAEGETLNRLAEMLERQMLEIAPEMRGVVAWNSIGQRRTSDELGRAAEHVIAMEDWMDA